MNFWASRLGGAQQPQQPPAQSQTQAEHPWWMAPPPPKPQSRVQNYVPGRDGPSIQEMSRMDASQLSQEALELIAEWKLRSNSKYENTCPHCGAENGLMRATLNTVARCVECGFSSRDVHSETGLQPLSKLRSTKDSFHARDVTGGSKTGSFSHVTSMGYREEGRAVS